GAVGGGYVVGRGQVAGQAGSAFGVPVGYAPAGGVVAHAVEPELDQEEGQAAGAVVGRRVAGGRAAGAVGVLFGGLEFVADVDARVGGEALHQAEQQVGLAREIRVDGALREAGGGRDVVQGGAVDAALRPEPLGGGEERGAGLLAPVPACLRAAARRVALATCFRHVVVPSRSRPRVRGAAAKAPGTDIPPSGYTGGAWSFIRLGNSGRVGTVRSGESGRARQNPCVVRY